MTPFLTILIVLALVLLYKTTSPYVAMSPPSLYNRPIPIDPPTPGLDWRLHPSIHFMGAQ
jgi:hypothetical protein